MQTEPTIVQLPDSKPATPDAVGQVSLLTQALFATIASNPIKDDGLIVSSLITVVMNLAYDMPHHRKRIADGLRMAARSIEEM